ncbi:polysaccharide lyase family 8 super-sandwich domain-containing protein [Pedobacter heparinus]|uniref:Chondroitin AC lyase n=1 Tax=Pedobacter heparinus (strain ATCC 13125 / DSM 2366 / CIP 104194 / JCM 7457 / NBRC 12017 / NCIMB 9290 / NRRL B-14731 / HIM 762-3) TaxID=485917 RepID=C6XV46_PEDHD|nr:polysaccharide lyase family 8 super-sandwich domain-containing protein [Pedobacter heparinus]ACU06054.1 Chondroitin AC lyase [Pedobacter heparinus DSM 2366]
MKKKTCFFFISLLFICHQVKAQADTILSRYKQYLLGTVKPEGDINLMLGSLNAEGQWPDINYTDTEKANWKNLIHLKRVRDLALVWEKPGSALYHNIQLEKAINLGLNHWLDKRYRNSNWWHNEIGVPQYMRDIIILMKKELRPEQLKAALEVMAQHRVQENWVGANLTWSADLGFHYGALTGNVRMMELCRNLIVKEIRISTEEGVQPDFSFHQHGARLQMYQYGAAFLKENIRLAWELRGTAMAFPKEKIGILTDFALKGWQWMARGIHTVPGTMDRSASRVNALDNADLREFIPYFIALSPENKNAFCQLDEIQQGKGALTGYRYYPYSDFAAFHQKDFSFFLKTISSRTLATESINSENLKGNLLNSGDAYLIRDGKEYFNLMPVWNWACLPGVTTFVGADKVNRQAFTGSVSNGQAGLTVMDYQLENKDKSKLLRAKKFWAVAGSKVLCLIAGLEGSGITAAYTTLDQCRWRGGESVNDSWIYHAGFAYIPLGAAKISLHVTDATGSWKEINAAESNTPLTEKIFMPVLEHKTLENGNSGYVISACKNAKEAARLVAGPQWKVLCNNKEIQAVSFNDGTIMAAFYQPGVLKTGQGHQQLSVDQPCLVLISNKKIWLSNPACKPLKVKLGINDQYKVVELPADGSSTPVRFH